MIEFSESQISSDATIRDPLTGLFSRALLHDRLHEEVARARRYGDPVGVLLVDLDYFKSVNDAFGHPRGDEVLRELGARLLSALRATDLPFRYGGDELVVLAPRTTRAEAAILANRLLDRIRREPFAGDPALSLSLSIGVASLPEDAQCQDTLFSEADNRLLEAKRRGRGRVVAESAVVASNGRQTRLSAPDRLLGQERAVEQMHAFLAASHCSGRGVLQVAGPPASGKTRFLQETARAASLQGWTVLMLRGDPHRPTIPFATLLAGWSSNGMQLRLPPTPDAAVRQLTAMAQAASGAASTSLLVAVDDAMAVDDETYEVLPRLLKSEIQRVAIVLSENADHRQPLSAEVADQLEIRPLDRDAVRAWLRHLLQWEPPAAFLDWMHRESAGLPGAIQRQLAQLVDRGLLTHEDGSWRLEPQPETGAGIAALTLDGPGPVELPDYRTHFVGREAELSQVRELLSGHRLVTLLGSRGIGKTRLAVQAARDLQSRFPDGVHCVSLACVRDPQAVVASIAQAIRVEESADVSLLEGLKLYLMHRRVLLVLDSFDDAPHAGGILAELLAAAAGLRILVTSRSPLRLYGEYPFPVPPLSLPACSGLNDEFSKGATSTRESSDPEFCNVFCRASAVTLFVDRLQSGEPPVSLGPNDAPMVTELCVRLGGVPLALELAAARARHSSLKELLRGLKVRIPTFGDPDPEERERTTRASIEWTYSELSPVETEALWHLAVYPTACSAEAAESMCKDFPQALRNLAARGLLAATEETGNPSRISDSIREFALEQAISEGAIQRIRATQAEYYVRLASVAERELLGESVKEMLFRLDKERSNLRDLLNWCSGQPGVPGELRERGLYIAAGVWRYWFLRNHLSEGARLLRAALDACASAPPELRARAAYGAGVLAMTQADFRAAQLMLEMGLLAARECGSAELIANILNSLGILTYSQGEYDQARQYHQGALELREQAGDEHGVGASLHNLGSVEHRLERWAEGDSLIRKSLQIFERLGSPHPIAGAVSSLAESAAQRGELDRAAELYRNAATAYVGLGDRAFLSIVVEGLAGIAVRLGEAARSVRLCAAAESMRERSGAGPASEENRRSVRQTLSAARLALDGGAFHEAWDAGRRLTDSEALAEAGC